jgi:DNA-binding transcriptional LysR family regulator
LPHSTSWDDFRLVKAIADARSLVGASETLGLNHSTLFRRLGALEQALGVRLFERSRLGYAPTAAGEEMIALAGRMAQEIIEFERTVAGRDVAPAGELRVTTNDTFLAYFLGPVLASFSRAYPQIRLDVMVGNTPLNLSRRDADVAIRASGDPPDTLVGRRIGPVNWAPYAPTPTEGGSHDPDTFGWIGFGDGLANVRAARWLAENVAERRIQCRVDSILGVAHLIAAGLGAGLLPCFIGDHTPGLVRFGEKLPDFGDGIWLLTHADLKNAARVRAFMDHAGSELIKCRKMLEGA